MGAVFHFRANPHAHLLAVARVGLLALCVGVRENAVVARCPRLVILEHFAVAGIVAGCEQDGFCGIDLLIVSVDILDDDTRHAAAVFSDQLTRPGAEHEVHAAGNANVVNVFHIGRMGGQANLAYIVEVIPVVFDVRIGRVRPVHFANAHGRAVVGVAFGAGAVLSLRCAEIPIQSFSGIIGPKLDDGHLGTIAAFFHD